MKHTVSRIRAAAFLAAALAMPAAAQAYEPGRADFSIRINGEVIPYEQFFATVMPNDTLNVQLAGEAPSGEYTLKAPGEDAAAFADGRVEWAAPDAPGESRELTISRADGETIRLRVFILRPIEEMEGEELNGFRIGTYPSEALRGEEAYEPPAGFLEVTQANMDAKVSPHFTLGQFLCHQQAEHWPKYVLMRPRMMLKLEALLEDVNEEKGIEAGSFYVMSGYRTPWYNAAIGNTTTYSRHVYGGASDIYIDVDPKDGDMDDVNGDGQMNFADARWLHDRADALTGTEQYDHLIGGLGAYDSNPAHGPFVHVDARGYEARW